MSNFSYYTPTHVYFGRGTQNQVGELVRAQGCKKVLIHYGGQSARRSGLLAQVEASLDAAGVAHVQLGGAVPTVFPLALMSVMLTSPPVTRLCTRTVAESPSGVGVTRTPQEPR